MSISAVSCLICRKHHTPAARVQHIKLENENIFEGNATDGFDTVENQGHIIFLLRKLLEIPKDVCSYLRQSYGDPCLGVSCCDSCSVLVDKGRRIFQELSLLQKQLENVKNELKTTIVNSQQPNSNSENEMTGATVTVRSYITSANREKIFIQNCDKILAVKLTDCYRIPSKSPSVLGENHFGVEADDNIDVKIHSGPYSCHEDDAENDPNEDGIYPNCSEPLSRCISTSRLCFSEEIPFKCDICGKRYNSSESLKNHKRYHTGRLACTICGKRFKRHYALRCHQRTHTGEKPYECNICGNRYSMSNSLNRHKLTHTEGKPHKCETCGKCFAVFANLQDHQKVHDVETQSDICAETFSSSDILSKHKKDHSTTCKICGKKSTSLSGLKNHQKIHTGEMPYECKLCSFRSPFSSCLSRHMLIHTEEKPHKCETCGKSFTILKYLQGHQSIHTGEKPFVCEFCHKRFSHLDSLKKHKIIHTRPFTCEICGKVFASLPHLISHKRTHTGEQPYECKLCGYRFSFSASLKRHMLAHTGEKRHKCDTCGKSFALPKALKHHIRIHTIERPFVRRTYGKGCLKSSQLNAHLKTHKGETPNVGSSSGKVVSDSISLKKPLVVHSEEGGEKSFKCALCDEAFQTFDLLVHHAFSHQENQSFESNMAFGDSSHHETQNKSVEISEEEDQKDVFILS